MNLPDRQDDRSIRRAAHEWRTALSRPGIAADELARFQAWREADVRHAEAYDRAATVWEVLGTLQAEDLDDTFLKRSWRERLPQFLFASSSANTGFRLRVVAAASIAVVAVVAGLALIRTTTMIEGPDPEIAVPAVFQYASQAGATRSLTLADGSAVTLGARTEITVTLSDRAREVRLSAGAALFSVAKDTGRPFSVHAGDLTVTAIGTQFDVRNNGGVARVGVTEGVVEVSYPRLQNGEALVFRDRRRLQAGEQVAATRADGLRSIESVAIDNVGAWRTNRLRYSGATLAELVADARRHSGRTIVVEDKTRTLATQKVTAFFDGGDIDGMLSALPDILPVVVDRTDPAVTVIRARSER